MTTLLNDNLTRANENPLGAPYAKPSGFGNLQLLSNQLAPQTAAVDSWMYHNVSYPNDQWCQFTVAVVGDANGGAVLRMSTANDGYFIVQSGGQIQLYIVVAGVFTSLAGSSSVYALNDIVYGEVQGTTIIVKLNGTTIITVTNLVITSGRPGPATNNTFRIGAFSAGDFAAALSTPSLPIFPNIAARIAPLLSF